MKSSIHTAEWKKAVLKHYILYVFINMTLKKKKKEEQTNCLHKLMGVWKGRECENKEKHQGVLQE